jgi:trimethylamine--corrinoid protein Co-methyltransferase
MIRSVTWVARQDLIAPESIQSIHAVSLRILDEIGIRTELEAPRLSQAIDLGLWWDAAAGRLHLPPQIVLDAIGRAPPAYTLHARAPENDIYLDGNHGFLGLDGCGIQVLDPGSSAARPSTKDDLQAIARLADALEQIAFLWPAVTAGDCPPQTQPLHELEALLTGSAKHIQAMTAVVPRTARGTIEMAAEVVGGPAELRRRPIVSNFQCSLSPLTYDGDSLSAAFTFAEAGIPTGFVAMPIGCATAPASVPDIAAQVNAEVLAGIALLELFYPGTPTFYGACATMMDLRTGGITSGGPEDLLLQAAACQLAHTYGLPAHIGTFATGSPFTDWRAGVENATSGAASHLTGADMICGAGQLSSARVFSFEQLLLDCELHEMLSAVGAGCEALPDPSLAPIRQGVEPGDFLTTQDTLARLEEIWDPSFLRSASRETPVGRAREVALDHLAGKTSGAEPRRLRRKPHRPAVEIVRRHEAPPLPNADRVREVVAAYERP